MTSSQQVGILVNVGIYVALIGFVLYRQMRRLPLSPRRLVLLPVVIALFAVQQLSRQSLAFDLGTIAFLGVSLAVSLLAGMWRGATFRMWTEGGVVMTKGTALTLIAWGVLIALRLPFAFASHAANYPQGLVVGELLLALAVTFAAQNAVIWLRSSHLATLPADAQ
jgi:hypothetical protein